MQICNDQGLRMQLQKTRLKRKRFKSKNEKFKGYKCNFGNYIKTKYYLYEMPKTKRSEKETKGTDLKLQETI